VAAGLEAVSEAKGALDEAKGAMLEEISATVTAITDSLRQRKAQLAPQIQALRDVRSAHQVGRLERGVRGEVCRAGQGLGRAWRWTGCPHQEYVAGWNGGHRQGQR
jgi:hypothetical protein